MVQTKRAFSAAVWTAISPTNKSLTHRFRIIFPL